MFTRPLKKLDHQIQYHNEKIRLFIIIEIKNQLIILVPIFNLNINKFCMYASRKKLHNLIKLFCLIKRM